MKGLAGFTAPGCDTANTGCLFSQTATGFQVKTPGTLWYSAGSH